MLNCEKQCINFIIFSVETQQNEYDKTDKLLKPPETDDEPDSGNYPPEMEGDSYFFTYFMLLCIIFIVGYVCYHNKQKVIFLHIF